MDCDLCSHRARVGCFHAKAEALDHKLSFRNHSNSLSFLILTFLKSRNRLLLALFVYMFIDDLPLVFKQPAAGDMSQVHRKGLLTTITDIVSYTLVTSQKLLLR